MINWIVVAILVVLAFLYMRYAQKQDRKEGYEQGAKENRGRRLDKWEMIEYHPESIKTGFCVLEIGETSLKIELHTGSPFDDSIFWVEFPKDELEGIEKVCYRLKSNGNLVKIS